MSQMRSHYVTPAQTLISPPTPLIITPRQYSLPTQTATDDDIPAVGANQDLHSDVYNAPPLSSLRWETGSTQAEIFASLNAARAIASDSASLGIMPPSQTTIGSMHPAIIFYSSLGAVFVVLLLSIIVYWLRRERRRPKEQLSTGELYNCMSVAQIWVLPQAHRNADSFTSSPNRINRRRRLLQRRKHSYELPAEQVESLPDYSTTTHAVSIPGLSPSESRHSTSTEEMYDITSSTRASYGGPHPEPDHDVPPVPSLLEEHRVNNALIALHNFLPGTYHHSGETPATISEITAITRQEADSGIRLVGGRPGPDNHSSSMGVDSSSLHSVGTLPPPYQEYR